MNPVCNKDFEPLQRSCIEVEKSLKYDEKIPDLGLMTGDGDELPSEDIRDEEGSHKYFNIPPCVTAQAGQRKMFYQKNFFKIPSDILRQISYDDNIYTTFMGILPEIHRVWITIDNRLYLWNYNQNDYIEYSEIPEIIYSVTLVTPKAGHFTAKVKYALIVITPIEIHLLAVSMDDDFRNVSITKSGYTAPTEDITFMSVASSRNGRIFMGGHDGYLYEFTYSKQSWGISNVFGILGGGDESKFGKRVKLNGSFMTQLSFRELFSFQKPEPLVKVAVDDMRNYLYTLSSSGVLRIYTLDDGEGNVREFQNSVDLISKAQVNVHRSNLKSSPKSQELRPDAVGKPQGMFVIPPTEAASLNVLVVFSSGLRVYVNVIERGEKRGNVKYVRLPPDEKHLSATQSEIREALSFGSFSKRKEDFEVSRAYYCHGVMLQSLGSETSASNRLLAVCLDHSSIAKTDPICRPLDVEARTYEVAHFRETLSMLEFSSSGGERIYDLCEVDNVVEDSLLSNHVSMYKLRRLYYASRVGGVPSPSYTDKYGQSADSCSECIPGVFREYCRPVF